MLLLCYGCAVAGLAGLWVRCGYALAVRWLGCGWAVTVTVTVTVLLDYWLCPLYL